MVSNSPASKNKSNGVSLHSTVLEETNNDILNANENNINAERTKSTMQDIDVEVLKEDCIEKETIESAESSLVRQLSKCTGETKNYEFLGNKEEKKF